MRNCSYLLSAALLTTAAALAGCCCAPCKNALTPPPPISPEEQIRRLSDWSASLPGIKAKTVLAGVRLDYQDDKGNPHSVNAEGLLQIRQHFVNAGLTTPVADVLLLGKSFDQPAFEAGRSAANWWFAIRLDNKKAWVGDATKPLDYSALGATGTAGILRADLVPDLLALSPLPNEINRNATRESGGGPITLMLVNDATATNNLLVGQTSGAGRPFVSREIIVDRISGHVAEVRLYDPAGVMVVRSRLRDFKPVSYEEGATPPAVAPEFPRKVEVSYPAQHLTVTLEFGDVKVATEFSDAVFRIPDFERQGLQIIPAE